MAFRFPVDIANRGLQHCGATRIDQTLGFNEQSKNAAECSFCYDKLRLAELQRNIWTFATRKVVLRPVDTNTLLLVPALWSSSATYFVGSIVSDSTGQAWLSTITNNTNNQPETSAGAWAEYFGPLTVSLYDSTQAYFAGELVYTAAGNGTYNTYLSKTNQNAVDPSLPNQWSVSTTYFKNQVVQAFPAWSSGTTYSQGQTISYTDGNVYTSLVASNLNNIPPNNLGSKWALVPVLTLASQPVPSTTLLTPPQSSPVIEWSQATTYVLGNVVMFNGTEYVSIANNNTGNFPNASGSTFWAAMTGGTQYMSLIDLNVGNNPGTTTVAAWASGTTYATGNQVTGSDGVIYTSLSNGNVGHDPTLDGGVHWQNTNTLSPWTTVFTLGAGNQQWLQIGGASFPFGVALIPLNIVYPIGAGPASQSSTRNVFRLPSGFLRQAPQDSKAGSFSWLGAPTNLIYQDWEFQGKYIVSQDAGPIVFPFIADTTDVSSMHPLFCEGLAARIGIEVCEPLTQSDAKIKTIASFYQKFMSEARMVDAVIAGAIEAALDDLIACRL